MAWHSVWAAGRSSNEQVQKLILHYSLSAKNVQKLYFRDVITDACKETSLWMLNMQSSQLVSKQEKYLLEITFTINQHITKPILAAFSVLQICLRIWNLWGAEVPSTSSVIHGFLSGWSCMLFLVDIIASLDFGFSNVNANQWHNHIAVTQPFISLFHWINLKCDFCNDASLQSNLNASLHKWCMLSRVEFKYRNRSRAKSNVEANC